MKTLTTEERNARLLKTMDASGNNAPVADQIGILVMALVLATRRILKDNKIQDRGRRMRVIKSLISEVDSRLRKYVPESNTVLVEEIQQAILRGELQPTAQDNAKPSASETPEAQESPKEIAG